MFFFKFFDLTSKTLKNTMLITNCNLASQMKLFYSFIFSRVVQIHITIFERVMAAINGSLQLKLFCDDVDFWCYMFLAHVTVFLEHILFLNVLLLL